MRTNLSSGRMAGEPVVLQKALHELSAFGDGFVFQSVKEADHAFSLIGHMCSRRGHASL
jgi:hypothetical protein